MNKACFYLCMFLAFPVIAGCLTSVMLIAGPLISGEKIHTINLKVRVLPFAAISILELVGLAFYLAMILTVRYNHTSRKALDKEREAYGNARRALEKEKEIIVEQIIRMHTQNSTE